MLAGKESINNKEKVNPGNCCQIAYARGSRYDGKLR